MYMVDKETGVRTDMGVEDGTLDLACSVWLNKIKTCQRVENSTITKGMLVYKVRKVHCISYIHSTA